MLRLERLAGEVGATVEFPEVLLAGSDDNEAAIHIGRPLGEDAVVRAQITAQGRDRKILVYKKKRRKNYRRRRGHRQSITTVRVTEIASEIGSTSAGEAREPGASAGVSD